MAILERIEPFALPWTRPLARPAGRPEPYRGRHQYVAPPPYQARHRFADTATSALSFPRVSPVTGVSPASVVGTEVIPMATLDRIEPAYTPWTPSAAGLVTDDETYVGRHRKPHARALSLRAMFYTARHRAR
jgi:hypothetical protein